MKSIHWLGWIAIFLISTTPHAHADSEWSERIELGGKAGLDLARNAGPGANDEFVSASYKLGFTAGGTFGYRFTPIWGALADITFTRKGTHSSRDGMDSNAYTMSYLEIPVLLRATLPTRGKASYNATLGPALGILLDLDVTQADGMRFDLDGAAETFDIGLMVGAGAAVAVGTRGHITFDVRYNHGLRNIDKTAEPEGDDVMNRAFYFTLGYRTNLDTLLGGSSDATATPREPASRPASISPASPSKP